MLFRKENLELPNLRTCPPVGHRYVTSEKDSAKYTRPLSTKAQLKDVRALKQKKYRVEQGRFLAQGRKVVSELLGSGWAIEAIYSTSAAARDLGISDGVVLPDHEIDRLGSLENGNEVIAVVSTPVWEPIAELSADELVLALDGVTDPGNLGTLLRIADWFGVRHVVCSDHSVEAFNPKSVQASMGAIFRVQVHYADLSSELVRLRQQGGTLYMASMEGRSVFERILERPAVLVLGGESHGLTSPVREIGGELIAVPRIGGAESLNVSMAAAALFMEFTRQRAPS